MSHQNARDRRTDDTMAIPNATRLDGRVVILTGAAGGLAAPMARALLDRGAFVVGIDLPAARDRLAALTNGAARTAGIFVPFEGDIAEVKKPTHLVATTLERFGRVDAVINNAGIGPYASGPLVRFQELDPEAWTRGIDVNVNAAFRLARAAVPTMIGQGWGRIVNLTTSLPTMLFGGFSPYGPSKAALEAATVGWSRDLAGTGVTVNAILPGGPADTPFVSVEEAADRSTLVRPDVMIAPLIWLLSHDSDGVTGFRFSGRDWDPSLPAADAARCAGRPGAWPT